MKRDGHCQDLWLCNLSQRADELDLLRRVALPGYDLSLLVTARHLSKLGVESIIAFIYGLPKEVSVLDKASRCP